MNFVAIDTSRKIMELTGKINNTEYNYSDRAASKASVTLMPAIDDWLTSEGIRISDLDCIGICVGPGSFTGIRIGVTTAKALSYGAGIRLVAFDTLEMLAYKLIGIKHDSYVESIISIMDSGNGNYYASVYAQEGDRLIQLLPPCVLTSEQLAIFAASVDEPSVIIADCDIAAIIPHINIYRVTNCHDSVRIIMAQAEQGYRPYATYNEVEPIYVQLSQAEKNLCR